MAASLALSIPGALAAIVIAIFGFAVVIAVCFVLLRLISFVTSGGEEPDAGADMQAGEPAGEPPDDPSTEG